MPMPALPDRQPDIRLHGKVDDAMLTTLLERLDQLEANEPAVVEISTSGGDADTGRRIAYELRAWQQRAGSKGEGLYVVGKCFVYSAGVTVLAAVPPSRRFLSSDCELLIHERKVDKTLQLHGSLRACRALVESVMAEIASGERLERSGFAELVRDTHLSLETLEEKLRHGDWYVPADEALRLGLVAGLI